MGKRGREKRSRKGTAANHGKRPNASHVAQQNVRGAGKHCFPAPRRYCLPTAAAQIFADGLAVGFGSRYDDGPTQLDGEPLTQAFRRMVSAALTVD